MLTNVPRIRDVEVLLEMLRGLGATVEGVGTPTLRIRCATVTHRPAGSGAGRQAARVGAAARAAARPPRLGAAGAARRRLPGPAHDLDASAGADRAWARSRSTSPATRSTRRTGSTGASMYLDEASVTGTETALLAAAAATGAQRDPARRDGTARRRAVPVPAGDGRRASKGRERRRSASRACKRLAGAAHRLDGDYIEAGSWGVVAAITGGEIEVTGARTADLEVIAAPLLKMGLRLPLRRRHAARGAVAADRGAADHDRPVAGLPERHGQPRHRAGDAGRGADARPRLALRAAALRARAAERDARGPVSLRLAPDDRHRPDASCAAGSSTAATCVRGWR